MTDLSVQNASQTHSGAQGDARPVCPECRQPFTPKRDWQRWCGKLCRNAYHKRRHGASVKPLMERIAEAERQLAELREQVAMIRGHLVL
jgi:hypothetical protein